MKIIKPSFTELFNDNPQKHIEGIARTCYKSTDLITEDSHKQFIKNLYDRKHWAMLEHYIFVYKLNYIEESGEYSIFLKEIEQAKYINHSITYLNSTVNGNDERYIISFSARSLLDLLNHYVATNFIMMKNAITELIEQVVLDYDCDELFGNRFKKVDRSAKFVKIDDITKLTPEEQWIHGWKSIKFICDRGVSHEIVRHRDASFAQESTRYCNYAKDKFGKEITVIKPCYLKDGSDNPNNEMVAWGVWKRAIENSEKSYFEMLDLGCNSQEARAVLPNSLKTEIIMTAHNYEWGHFFELRCDKAAHPQMRELSLPLFDYFTASNSLLFNRDNIKFTE